MTDVLTQAWTLLLAVTHVSAAAAVTLDAVLRKRHVSVVIGWVGLAWLAPVIGSLLYLVFGINRIQRSALALGLRQAWESDAHPHPPDFAATAGHVVPQDDPGLAGLDRLCERVTGNPLLPGNRIKVLDGGDAAGVTAAAFLPTRNPLRSRYANPRNHRKIMVVDGTIGFTGGINIRAGHWLERRPSHPVRCLHFGVQGPVVADLQRTFAVDWAFATGEQLLGERWFPRLATSGLVDARGTAHGPDADIDNLPPVLLGALAVARTRERIVTPYFLPDETVLRSSRPGIPPDRFKRILYSHAASAWADAPACARAATRSRSGRRERTALARRGRRARYARSARLAAPTQRPVRR